MSPRPAKKYTFHFHKIDEDGNATGTTECGLDSQNEEDIHFIFDKEYEKTLMNDESPKICTKCDEAMDWVEVDDNSFD